MGNEDFVNPEKIKYQGPFSVELTEGTSAEKVPPSVIVSGTILTIENGRIVQSIGAINLYSNEEVFYIGYRYLKCIRDGEGNFLWINRDYRKEVLESV